VLTLILADTELELVPPQIQSHPSVRAYAKRRGRSPASTLLDSSFHHPALRRVPEGDRRGRPDIAHLVLVLCLDSLLNLEGRLRTIVHTRNDDVIQFAPETRIPKHYARFVGLMEELFEKGHVPDKDPLIVMDRGVTLEQLLAKFEGMRWAFSEQGELVDLPPEMQAMAGDFIAVVGGFPHGGFRSPVPKICNRVVSLHGETLKAWTVASELLVAYRRHVRPEPPKDTADEPSGET